MHAHWKMAGMESALVKQFPAGQRFGVWGELAGSQAGV